MLLKSFDKNITVLSNKDFIFEVIYITLLCSIVAQYLLDDIAWWLPFILLICTIPKRLQDIGLKGSIFLMIMFIINILGYRIIEGEVTVLSFYFDVWDSFFDETIWMGAISILNLIVIGILSLHNNVVYKILNHIKLYKIIYFVIFWLFLLIIFIIEYLYNDNIDMLKIWGIL